MDTDKERKRPPAFLITIDTEGDNLWARPQRITTRNARYLSRFQALCESYGLRPCYLTNYEMANDPAFQEFGQDLLQRDVAEIGMHLHAWNMPPCYNLTENDYLRQPYLIEYPPEVMRAKIVRMTDLLEEVFGVKMVSHRAGRWSFNEEYAALLEEHGYRVDCSVTPLESWHKYRGASSTNGGTDYSRFPDHAYFIDPADISRPGRSMLLEIPMTIRLLSRADICRDQRRLSHKLPLVRQAVERFWPAKVWLRPNGRNLQAMLQLLAHAVAQQENYVQFMLHSSEFMPGGSPNFPEERDIERLYDELGELFGTAAASFSGKTLKEYHLEFRRNHCLER